MSVYRNPEGYLRPAIVKYRIRPPHEFTESAPYCDTDIIAMVTKADRDANGLDPLPSKSVFIQLPFEEVLDFVIPVCTETDYQALFRYLDIKQYGLVYERLYAVMLREYGVVGEDHMKAWVWENLSLLVEHGGVSGEDWPLARPWRLLPEPSSTDDKYDVLLPGGDEPWES